jgi:hypothetical protein
MLLDTHNFIFLLTPQPDLDIGNGKHLHYLFYASQGSPSTDPVVLWYNGGPGCSSLEGGFQESGPYWTTTGGVTLQKNDYSWNLFSNSLFIEAPAGVGFSYCDTPDGCVHNDTATAADNLKSLEIFFAGFPEYKANDFWITGESYAGVSTRAELPFTVPAPLSTLTVLARVSADRAPHPPQIYVPSLAYDVVTSGSSINLKGIMVGNGCLGNTVGVCGSFYGENLSLAQYHGHGFISDKSFNAAVAACGDWSTRTPDCNAAARTAMNEVGPHDVYDLYAGMYGECPYGSRKGLKPVPRTRAPSARPVADDSLLAQHWEEHGWGNTCTDDNDLTTYMQTPAVIAALNVKAPTNGWQECGGISYKSDIADERTKIYPTLIAAKLHIVIYNGEADACVPITDNQWWTDSLNLTTTQPWTAWASADGTTGGYSTVYQAPGSFAFITIRGAGHMVPQVQPVYAFEFAKASITGAGVFTIPRGE